MNWTNLQAALQGYGEALVEKYRWKLEEKNIRNTGTLGDTVRVIVETPNAGVYELSLGLEEYYKYIEEGVNGMEKNQGSPYTRGKYPPPDAIQQWIRTKPIAPYASQNGKIPSERELAFLIGRKIALEGTEGRHPLGDSIEEIQEFWMGEIEKALERDVEADLDEIISNL